MRRMEVFVMPVSLKALKHLVSDTPFNIRARVHLVELSECEEDMVQSSVGPLCNIRHNCERLKVMLKPETWHAEALDEQ